MSTKETVGAFLGAVLNNDPATMRQLANADYIQHNPHIPTGLEPFIEMLPVLQQHGTTAENVRMFQDGNYVFMHNIWRNAKPFGADEIVSFDIIRVDDSGKVAEHWDAMTPEHLRSGIPSTGAPDPQWVDDAHLQLDDMSPGKRPVRTQVSISWGVHEINRLTQPIQDQLLKEMQLDAVLGRGSN